MAVNHGLMILLLTSAVRDALQWRCQRKTHHGYTQVLVVQTDVREVLHARLIAVKHGSYQPRKITWQPKHGMTMLVQHTPKMQTMLLLVGLMFGIVQMVVISY